MKNNNHTQSDEFPELVQFKSSTAKIDRNKHRGRFRYEVRYHDADSVLQRGTFDDYDGAKEHAETIVSQLAKGGLDMIALRGRERFVYETTMERLHPLGVPLDDAVAQYTEAMKLLGGQGALREAVSFFVKHRPANLSQLTVRTVLDEFLEHKIKDVEVSAVYLRDLRNRLGKFAETFQCPIGAIAQKDIVRYLRSLGVGKRTRINHRRNIGTLINYAKEQGYLPADRAVVPKEGKSRKDRRINVQVFTPPEMVTLLKGAWPDLVVPLAITAFSGVRAEELKRLDWKHVHLDEDFIEIPHEIAKTGVRSLVPITLNLKSWLSPYHQSHGPVLVYKNLANQYGKLANKLKFQWKRNALRHGFVSYRVAQIKNVPQVSLEAGNSPQMVQRHYLRVVTDKAASEWFGIVPTTPPNVVGMPAAPRPGSKPGTVIDQASEAM